MDKEEFMDNIIKKFKNCFKLCCWRTSNNHYDYMELGVEEDDFTIEEKKNNELRQHMNKNAHEIKGEKITFHDDDTNNKDNIQNTN